MVFVMSKFISEGFCSSLDDHGAASNILKAGRTESWVLRKQGGSAGRRPLR